MCPRGIPQDVIAVLFRTKKVYSGKIIALKLSFKIIRPCRNLVFRMPQFFISLGHQLDS